MKTIKYWLAINHLDRIKQYGLKSHLNYMFNFNLSRFCISMQADLEHLPPLEFPKGYAVREMDVNDEQEIKTWLYIVNTAYTDAEETSETFQKHLHNHSFLTNQKVFFIYKENDVKNVIGTVSVGIFKSNAEWGGDSRIAILPSERGKGLGFFAVNYAFHYLFENMKTCKGESVISFHRNQSLVLHYKCGFKPQFDRKKLNFDTQKRMWPIRQIAKMRVNNLLERV